jgi:HAD superfamily hydrolase (TIGR01509 family)
MKELSKLINNKKLLIFDFDGTLANTSPLHDLAFRFALSNYEFDFSYSEVIGLSTNDALEYLFNKNNVLYSNEDLKTLVLKKQQHVRELIASDLKPIEGLSEFLKSASLRFHLCIVSSGSSANISAALNKLGYYDYFDPVLSIEDVSLSKPNPEGFKLALQITSFGANEAIIFEDSEKGFEAAKNAHIDFINVNLIDWQKLTRLIS